MSTNRDNCWVGLEVFTSQFGMQLEHLSDGRFLRVDFGPGGCLDTSTGWGVLQFVMASKVPWREFPELRAHLAGKPPPYDELSGSHERMVEIVDKLEAWD